jgi:hypothetical protein
MVEYQTPKKRRIIDENKRRIHNKTNQKSTA